jgi:5-methylcytosine-specific restriction endonuclease McrA
LATSSWIRPATREAIYLRDHRRCVYCQANDLAELHLDHVVPRAQGGSNDPGNLITSCGPCNQRKHAKTLQAAYPGPEHHILRERVTRHLKRPINQQAGRILAALKESPCM